MAYQIMLLPHKGLVEAAVVTVTLVILVIEPHHGLEEIHIGLNNHKLVHIAKAWLLAGGQIISRFRMPA
jgi:hypothetical protein